MKPIAKRTAKRGKKQVKLIVYSCYNTLIYEDKSTNYLKVLQINNYLEAESRFYEWTIQMHGIKTNTTLYQYD